MILKMKFITIIFVLIFIKSNTVNGHGRVMEPPNRSSLWRFPTQYKNVFPEENYDDNQIWCGGIGVQYEVNKGKCGPCGDAWNAKTPRENEDGGRYGRAIISGVYTPGQVIHVAVELTANHLGHFEFNLCPLTFPEVEECFQKYPLHLADGSGTKYMVPRNTTGYYNTTLLLPKDLKCKQCSLRWHYRTANRWNFITNETGEVGAGDQEIFRTCSDITIGSFPPVTPRPPTHTIPEEMKPATEKPSSVETIAPIPGVSTVTTSTTKPTTAFLITTKPTKRPPPSMPAQKPPTMPAQKPPMLAQKPSASQTTSSSTVITPRPVTQKPGGFPMQRPPQHKPESSSTTTIPTTTTTTTTPTTTTTSTTTARTTTTSTTTAPTTTTSTTTTPQPPKPQRPESQNPSKAPIRPHPIMKPPVPFPK